MYNSEDTSSIQAYDCVYHQSYSYCRRPLQSILLQRDSESHRCYHNGISHSFRALRANNITVHTVLQKWKSTIEMVDQYAHYLRLPMDTEDEKKQICECINRQSFGKSCEYLLPFGNTFTDVANTKFTISSKKLAYVGEIVCYTTLKCDFGLLCLDWRDICDGVQQCMFGLDEENCDKLEFNECEEDEYRCMNGMCIPDEYFLDGEYDCMDMSDEKVPFSDVRCPFQMVSMECDDRVCPPNLWSCGDGQCIIERSIAANMYTDYISCSNRRDQFFWCERAEDDALWTEPNGRCIRSVPNVPMSINSSCAHLLLCASAELNALHCPCEKDISLCTLIYLNHCSTYGLIPYPSGGLFAPYAFHYFDVTNYSSSVSLVSILDGTIKCRGYLTSFTLTVSNDFFWMSLLDIESFLCSQASSRSKIADGGYNPHCHSGSRTFSNRSYHWIDVCEKSNECISAYRINDGFGNCENRIDELQDNTLLSKSCSNVRHHRFRCSLSEATCLSANTLADLARQCRNTANTLSKSIQIAISRAQCNSQSTVSCSLLRGLIEASQNHTLYNYTGLQKSQLKNIPFRRYCDTFQDTLSNGDED